MQLPNTVQDWIASGIILGVTLLGMALIQLLWRRILTPLANRVNIEPDDSVLSPLRNLLTWGLALVGFQHTLSILPWMQAHPKLSSLVDKVVSILWALLILWTVQRLIRFGLDWYVHRANPTTENLRKPIGYQVTLVRKIVNVILAGVGLIYILRAAGADISPLLASGAIGGLAVALAAQDTLSNLFAGFYLTLDRPVRVGDFIKLETGEEGFVEEIGWRNTRVRVLPNNLVVIPNSKLSQSVLTNYYLPEPDMSLYVWCGVSYDSDLQYVENVSVEVARQLQRTIEGADPEWEPVVRWKEFGDSAIKFLVALRVQEYAAQFLLQSEFIKALHTRFRQEGIDIPFPIRTVVIKPPIAPERLQENGAASRLAA